MSKYKLPTDRAEEKRDAVIEAARIVCATAMASWYQPGMIGVEAKPMNQLRNAVSALQAAEAERATA